MCTNTSTCLTQLILGHCMVQIWSRNVQNCEPTKPANSNVWCVRLVPTHGTRPDQGNPTKPRPKVGKTQERSGHDATTKDAKCALDRDSLRHHWPRQVQPTTQHICCPGVGRGAALSRTDGRQKEVNTKAESDRNDRSHQKLTDGSMAIDFGD